MPLDLDGLFQEGVDVGRAESAAEIARLRQEKRKILKIVRSWSKNEHPERATTAMAILEEIRAVK